MNYLELKNQKRAFRPLFDRFLEARLPLKDGIFLNEKDLYASIASSLSDLLNTRCFITEMDYDFIAPEQIDYGIPALYGIPDFSQYDPSNKLSWQKLKRYMTNAIRLYETRLKVIDLEVASFDRNTQTLTVMIRGKALFEGIFKYVSFPIDVGHSTREKLT